MKKNILDNFETTELPINIDTNYFILFMDSKDIEILNYFNRPKVPSA
jgi:hypothetical protein